MKQRIFEKPLNIFLLSVMTLLLWFFDLAYIGLPLYALLILAILIFSEDTIDSIPILLSSLFMISQTEWSFELIPLYLYLVPLLLVIGYITHVIKYKLKPKKGKLFFPIIALIVAMLLSTINATNVDIYYLFYIAIGFLYFFIYVFYRSTIKGNFILYILRIMFALGILVSVEVLIYYMQVNDVYVAIETKSINLGWGISNFVATYLIMFIPATFYLAKIVKNNLILLLLGVFEIAMLFLTLSRGGILTFLFIFIFLMIYLFRSTTWQKTLFNFAISILMVIFLIYTNMTVFMSIVERFSALLFDDSGRLEIYQEALNKFMSHPLFGVGVFSRIDINGDFRMYHNTFLQTLASFGLFGLVVLLWQYVKMYQVLMYQIKTKTTVIAIAILGANIHGLIDNVYYMPQFMILFVIMIAIVEVSNQHYKLFLEQTTVQA